MFKSPTADDPVELCGNNRREFIMGAMTTVGCVDTTVFFYRAHQDQRTCMCLNGEEPHLQHLL